MVEAARRQHPHVRFEVGSLLALPVADRSLAAAVTLFAVIHLDGPARHTAYGELARVVRPYGWLLVGFHVSGQTPYGQRAAGEVAVADSWWQQPVDLRFHFLHPAEEAAALAAAGFDVIATLDREPYAPGEVPTRRCYLLVRRVADLPVEGTPEGSASLADPLAGPAPTPHLPRRRPGPPRPPGAPTPPPLGAPDHDTPCEPLTSAQHCPPLPCARSTGRHPIRSCWRRVARIRASSTRTATVSCTSLRWV